MFDADGIARCDCGGPVKPDVVLFGEMLPEAAMLEAHALCERADLLLCVGIVAGGVSGRGAAERDARGGRRRGDRDEGPHAVRRARPRCAWTATSWTSCEALLRLL